ncbi:G protein-coupled receptor 161-like [Tachypleus tridentatus]|uniref:G protein-coupled receptor 161-like n=1 Tax=Tachypleus tridentatus TaxID=6853 RepID=UPI003FD63D58
MSEESERVLKQDEILALKTENRIFLEFQFIAMLIVMVSSLFSNGLMFLIFYKKPLLSKSSNRFVLNLCVTHLLQSILVLPATLTSLIYKYWVFGGTWCQISGTVSLCLSVETVFSLLLIAVDRNCAVNSPLQYKTTTTKRRAFRLITSSWLFSVLVSLPPVFGVAPIIFEKTWCSCVTLGSGSDNASIFYMALLVLLGFLVPLLCTSRIYCSLFKAARANGARGRKHSLGIVTSYHTIPVQTDTSFHKIKPFRRNSTTSQLSLFGDEWKTVRTVLLVLFSFSMCWGPYFIVLFLSTYMSHVPPYIPLLSSFLSFSSCVVDPYVYFFRNQTVQRYMKKLFQCQTPKSYATHSNTRKLTSATLLRLDTADHQNSLSITAEQEKFGMTSKTDCSPVRAQEPSVCQTFDDETSKDSICNLQEHLHFLCHLPLEDAEPIENKGISLNVQEKKVICYLFRTSIHLP